MDKRFNGLRYSRTLECLVRESGEEVRMRQSAAQVFSILNQNLNQLVTRQYLLELMPNAMSVSSDTAAANTPANTASNINDPLNNCMVEIKQLVGDSLKTIPGVGYLLTPDVAGNEQTVHAGVRKPSAGPVALGRSKSTVIRELVFNSQWLTCHFQNCQHAKLGSIVLLTALVLSFVDS